jgi:hypothetical protein
MIAESKDKEVKAHLARLHAALFNTYDLKDVAKYIAEKTYLKGERFSWKDHEFQKDIANDTAQDLNVQKCAQVGLSELMARYGISCTRIMPYFSTIMTMPFSGDATNFAKTRLDPIIADSPDLKTAIDPNLDNSEIKSIGTSLLYMRGCNGTTAALSVPADMLIHDEVDRSDPAILAQYQSRIKHSKWKLTRKFGTPTANKVGIALEMAGSKRWRHMCKCNHCNHQFVPSFHNHIVIPDYDRPFKEITKYNIDDIRWQEAYMVCPRCGKEPSLQFDRRQWVCENPDDNFAPKGYYVTPFSVPNIVTIPSLIKEITKYSWAEFCNQALGETAVENDAQLLEEDLENTKHAGDLDSTEMHNLGIDVGQICYLVVARLTESGMLLVPHRETCILDDLEKRKRELSIRYRILITVIDLYPETDKVHQMQKKDKNLYGGQYHDNAKLQTYSILMVEKDLKDGKLPVNQARIQRNLNFDELMGMFKKKLIRWSAKSTSDDKLFVAHCLDMSRKEEFRNNALQFVWQKSKEGNDHFMHALGYAHVACRLMPAASKSISFAGVPLLTTFRVKQA